MTGELRHLEDLRIRLQVFRSQRLLFRSIAIKIIETSTLTARPERNALQPTCKSWFCTSHQHSRLVPDIQNACGHTCWVRLSNQMHLLDTEVADQRSPHKATYINSCGCQSRYLQGGSSPRSPSCLVQTLEVTDSKPGLRLP